MKVCSESPETLSAMFKALALSQASYGELKRSKTVNTGKYKFNYAPLEEVLASVLPALNANGLYLSQWLDIEDGKAVLVTMISHESGAFMSSKFPIQQSEAMQDLGSDLTYLKRYALSAAVGVSPEDDDDGNRGKTESVTNKSNYSTQVEVSSKQSATPSKEQLEQLRSFMVSHGFETPEQRAGKYKLLLNKTPQSLTKDDIELVVKAVEAEAVINLRPL